MCIALHVIWKWNPIIVFHFFLSTVITWLTVCFWTLIGGIWESVIWWNSTWLQTEWSVDGYLLSEFTCISGITDWHFCLFFLTFRISCFNAKCDWICCLCLLQSQGCFGVWHISWNHNSNPHMVCTGFGHCLCYGPRAEEGTLSRRKHRFLNMKHFL